VANCQFHNGNNIVNASGVTAASATAGVVIVTVEIAAAISCTQSQYPVSLKHKFIKVHDILVIKDV
jgi:hypothetical protein